MALGVTDIGILRAVVEDCNAGFALGGWSDGTARRSRGKGGEIGDGCSGGKGDLGFGGGFSEGEAGGFGSSGAAASGDAEGYPEGDDD